jgi:hypothetical protein
MVISPVSIVNSRRFHTLKIGDENRHSQGDSGAAFSVQRYVSGLMMQT